MRKLGRIGALALLAVLLAGCETGPRQCKLIVSGDMPVLNNWGSPIVRAAINSHPVALIIDTGALTTAIGKAFIDPLGLQDTGTAILMHGVGGEEEGRVMTIETLDLGTSRARNIAVMAVGTFPQRIGNLPVVGVFGRDFLGHYDTVVDMPRHRVRLVQTEDCSTPTPGWEGPVHAVRVDHLYGDSHKTTLDIRLNGHVVDAVLDTGASSTLVSMDAARSAGVTRAMLEHDPVSVGYGITHDPVKHYHHLFETLQVGDIVFHNVRLSVGGDLPDTDALVGGDMLRHYRIWIPRDGLRMYIQHDRDIPGTSGGDVPDPVQ